MRSAISSSTRCREVLPPAAAWAGFRERRLAGAAALLVLVLALGVLVLRLLVVMGRVFSFRVGVRLFPGWAGVSRAMPEGCAVPRGSAGVWAWLRGACGLWEEGDACGGSGGVLPHTAAYSGIGMISR